MVRKALVLAMVLAIAAFSGASAGTGKDSAAGLTVGAFSRSLVAALEASGVQVKEKAALMRGVIAGREQTPLTEGVAVALLGTIGLDASTSNPGRMVGEARGLTILRTVAGRADTLQPSSFAGTTATSTQGSIELCFSLSNHGKCVECCKGQGIQANSCAKACFVINKPSASEPLP